MTFITHEKGMPVPHHHKTLFVLLVISDIVLVPRCADSPCIVWGFSEGDGGPAAPPSVSATLSVGTSSSGSQWGIVC